MQFIIKGELELKLGDKEAGNIRLSAVLADKRTELLAEQSEPVRFIESKCGSTRDALEPCCGELADTESQESDWEA